uniref:Uncharacterized protein n=1 Tax=Arundo donax TaxID=35708 RepID=A0A0A9GWH6_ARUDO
MYSSRMEMASLVALFSRSVKR